MYYRFIIGALLATIFIAGRGMVSGQQSSVSSQADDEAAIAIYRAFYYDPLVDSALTQVSVVNGVATLTGTVPTVGSRRIAEAVARSTPGVTSVVNELVVGHSQGQYSDEEIYRNVRRAFNSDPQLDGSKLAVGVLNGRVHLAGPVPNVFMRAKAANLVGEVPGVVGVENAITVPQGANLYDNADTPPGDFYGYGKKNVRDDTLQERVEKRLRESNTVDARDVRVEMKDGVATLTGTVATDAERAAAEHQAYAAGATDIVDLLQLRPQVAAQP